ncbi:MAG: CHAD domain-containing protein [Myxococcaceae bacterium]|nr:CHAD domain-containing protein [Myxococcaceae bacterium]
MTRSLDEVLDSPAPAGVRFIALEYLDDWRATLPRLNDADDTEALHDYRVALRKLRSWLKTFDEGGDKAQKQLSGLNESTGEARDLEVFEQWLEKDESPAAVYAREQVKDHGEVDVARVEAKTLKVAEKLAERLSRYTLEVPLGAGAPVVPFSWAYASALRKLHNDLTEAALAASSIEDAELLHKVRIRAKRLRYALAPIKDWPEVGEALKLLKERQDLLGELHDRHAFVGVLAGIVRRHPPPDIAAGLEGLVARAHEEGHALYQQYAQHRHANDVRLAALIDVVTERLGKRMGLHVEVVPQG